MSAKIQQSAASFFKHCKPKSAVASALMLAVSVFVSPAQAELVQLDLSGPSFSGYLFFDTANTPGDPFGNGISYYTGFSYISSPFATGSAYPYTTKPTNPYTGAPLTNKASSSYHQGQAFLSANPSCTGTVCNYSIETAFYDGFAADLSFFLRQPDSSNFIINKSNSLPKTDITYILYDDGYYSNRLFSDRGTVSLPTIISPPASPVPEPATWALMIGGFGMIGGAARYKRRRTTPTYA